MMRKLFYRDGGEWGRGDDDGRSEQSRRRRERDDESSGAARGGVGPGRRSWRRRGVVVLREDCVEDLGVLAVVRRAYVVPLDERPVRPVVLPHAD